MRGAVFAVLAGVTTAKPKNEEIVIDTNKTCSYPPSPDLLDRKIEFITTELLNCQELSKGLHEISPENALVI